jgi:hypothetical protein
MLAYADVCTLTYAQKVDDSVITEVALSHNKQEEQALLGKGFRKVAGDINAQAGGDQVFIWYQVCSRMLTYADVCTLTYADVC